VLKAHGISMAQQTYQAYKKRPPSKRALSDAAMCEHIEAVFFDRDKGRAVAGYRKVWHYIQRDGVTVARCTVQRLMRKMGLKGVRRNAKRVITTVSDQNLTSWPEDLVKRNFKASKPNELWVVDFCYIPTWSGETAYCAFVQDVFSRRIVGWRVANHMKADLPLDALEMALWIRDREGANVSGLIQHSDKGSQYTAFRYIDRLAEVDAVVSIGTVGDSYDNAMAESINGLYKAECVKIEGPWKTVDSLELATADWVHYWNNNRLHSSLGYVPPAEFEAAYYNEKQPQLQPV